jgi:hypothetical protein
VKTRVSARTAPAVFENVRPSAYTVRFTLPDQAQPVTGSGDFTRRGSTMVSGSFTVGEGETAENVSGGLVSYTSVGGAVVLDVNGMRTAQANVKVTLYASESDTPCRPCPPDEQGDYRFDGLWPVEYRLTSGRPPAQSRAFQRPHLRQGASVVVDTVDGVGEATRLRCLGGRPAFDERYPHTARARGRQCG